MIPASQMLLEEYERMASKAAPHVLPADSHTLQDLLRQIQVHVSQGEAPPAPPGADTPGTAFHPSLIQAATGMDSILSMRLEEVGKHTEFDEHIYRVRSFMGRWPL